MLVRLIGAAGIQEYALAHGIDSGTPFVLVWHCLFEFTGRGAMRRRQ
jgi:hypothetical protein